MPGILPMKVIKVGANAQSRIAQACDRCRSKKIRCDGIRPCCTQCANVGFECKTSDKLSRRAFPRGYTESLEERVRQLEGEVRELKDLLDEKDEKIEMLSKMHENRRPSVAPSSPAAPSPDRRPPAVAKDDVVRIQTSPLLLGDSTAAYFMGASSGRSFIDTLKRTIQESGKSCAPFNMTAIFNEAADRPAPVHAGNSVPARLFSDKCVNVFFQEWAPLFPVLHKPTFLHIYESYVNQPDEVREKAHIAQLHLIFTIAALSSGSTETDQLAACEAQWMSALDDILMDNTVSTLQCLVLAQIYCIAKGDYKRLIHYKGIAVGLSHRLGLHQSQKRFAFGALSTETRKKVFWTLYVLDCFSAALLGLPKLLQENDIHAEYPTDIDDEYVTERGFQPTLPGEHTKLSSALALFRVARIMSAVLDQVYPAAASYELSLHTLSALDQQLSDWFTALPAHLKLTFAQDKPSTDITGNRSVFLSLTYYYVKTLIHRPVIGSGPKASASVLAVGDASKHMMQIVQLLTERNMSFTYCLNKNELLTFCGLHILYRCLDAKQDGKLLRDGQRQVADVVKLLEAAKAPAAAEFNTLATSIMHAAAAASKPASPGPNRTPAMATAKRPPSVVSDRSASVHRDVSASPRDALRRATLPGVPPTPAHHAASHRALESGAAAKREHRASLPGSARPGLVASPKPKPNLDYLPLSSDPAAAAAAASKPSPTVKTLSKPGSQLSEWESLLGSLDGGQTNIYDAMFGGPPLALSQSQHSSTLNTPELSDMPLHGEPAPPNSYDEWSPDSWGMPFAGLNLNAYSSTSELSVPYDMASSTTRTTARSVLSLSDESLSSGQDDPADLGARSEFGSTPFIVDGLEANFGL